MSTSAVKWKGIAKRVLGPRWSEVASLHYARLRRPPAKVREWLTELQWSYSADGRAVKHRLSKMHNSHRGKRCFVIGNGPSLRDTDLRKLEDEVTIGCNGLFLAFDEMGFLPTLFTVEDRLVAQDRAAEINEIRGTIKVFPRDLSYYLSLDDDTVYINFIRNYVDFPKFSGRFDRVVYWGGTVTFLNLQLAYYVGCRQVYLIGVDHSYTVPSHAVNDVIVSRESDVNHFHPDYFGPGYRYHDPKMWRMEQSYRQARAFFESQGGMIYNATRGGKLEIFPRVDFDGLFG
jgi:hypothetical protein